MDFLEMVEKRVKEENAFQTLQFFSLFYRRCPKPGMQPLYLRCFSRQKALKFWPFKCSYKGGVSLSKVILLMPETTMKMKCFIALAALAIGTATVAKADQISINGSDNTTATSIIFSPTTANIGGVSTGIFAPFGDCIACVTMVTPLTFSPFTNPTELFSATEGGNTIQVWLTSVAVDTTMGLALSGADYTIINGGPQVVGTYLLTTQTGTGVTFSETSTAPTPTPEPSSIALFGTGMLAAAGVIRRRLVK
jgi:hypothetical protein